MSKRGNGEGSIYRRESDGKWVGVVHLGYEGGTRKRKAVYGKTRAEVAEKLRQVQHDLDGGTALPDERQRTGEYLAWWLTEVVPGTVKDSTADGYRYMLRRYVIPAIGRVALAKLTPAHVQTMLRDMERRGLSASTRRQTRAILRRSLGHAERWGLVRRNAAALVDCPSRTGAKLDDALSEHEAVQLLRAAQGDRLEALVTVALASGLRKGEALALRWADVDLDAGTITISGTLKRRTGHGLVVDAPKTSAANRTVPVPSVCVAALRAHRTRQSAERLRAGIGWRDEDFVFTTPIGTPLDPRNVTRLYHALCERAGLGRQRFHALRHSAATLMLAQGVPLEVISKTLGHSGLAITADVYAKVGERLQRQAAEAMDGLLGAASGAPA